MKARQPYHLSWQLLTAVIIIGFVIFVEYWPHVTDNTLMGGALVSGGPCFGTFHKAAALHKAHQSAHHKEK